MNLPPKKTGKAVDATEARRRIEALAQNPEESGRATKYLFQILRGAIDGRALTKSAEPQRKLFQRILEEDPALRAHAIQAIETRRRGEKIEERRKETAAMNNRTRKKNPRLEALRALGTNPLTHVDETTLRLIRDVEGVLARIPRMTERQKGIAHILRENPDLLNAMHETMQRNRARVEASKMTTKKRFGGWIPKPGMKWGTRGPPTSTPHARPPRKKR